MPISSFVYEAPVRRKVQTPALDYHLLEAAFALAEEGRAKEAIAKLLAHVFPGRAVPDVTREPFSFTQGSSRVTLQMRGDELMVTVPLIRLPTGGTAVAALRYLLTRISGSGQLHQPRLRGDEVSLEFSDQVTHLHPAKLLEVLRRMPLEADSADDWLIGQFGATALARADIAPLAPDELARALAIWRTHWDEVEELLKESQRKRSMFFLNELTAYAVYRLRYSLPLCGLLSARLEEAFGVFNDGDTDPLKRETTLAKCTRDMKAATGDELRQSLGHAEYAISPLQEGKPEAFVDYFRSGDYLKTIDTLRTTGKSLDATLALVSTYCYLLGRFAWPDDLGAALLAGLAKVSGQPWREAAAALYGHTTELIERYEEADSDDDSDDSDQASEETAP